MSVQLDDLPVRTEAEIYADLQEEWMGVLASLWVAIGKPVDPERLRMYAQVLSDIPLGLLELSIKRVLRQQTWQVVPQPGVIVGAMEKELQIANVHNIPDWVEQRYEYLMRFSIDFKRASQSEPV